MPAEIPWCRAVWKEENQEEEGVVPFNWVVGKHVLWPVGEKNERKALMEQKEPNVKEWEHFDLIKIKITSDNKKECDDYNFTTTAEMSEDDEEETQEISKRQPKKKSYTDFVTGDISDVQPSTSGRSKKSDVNISVEELPPPPTPPMQMETDGISDNSRKRCQSGSRKKKNDKVSEVDRSESSRSPSPMFRSLSRTPSPGQSNRTSHKKPASRQDSPKRDKYAKGSSKKKTSHNTSYTQSLRSPSPMSGISRTPSPEQSYRKSFTKHARESDKKKDSSRRNKDPMGSSKKKSSTLYTESQRLPSPFTDISRTPSPERFRTYTSSKSRQRNTNDARGRDRVRSRSPVRRSRSVSVSQKKNEINFPMTEAKFQKRTLYLLCEIRDLLKRKHPVFIQGQDVNQDLEQTDSIEDFRRFDRTLNDKDTYCQCKSVIAKIGGSDFKDHMKKAMQRCMTNGLMSMMNMKGKNNKFPFGKSNLYKLLKEVLIACYDCTEAQLADIAAKYLKFSPERVGGGGRREQDKE